MAYPLASIILDLTFLTSDNRIAAVGTNTAAFLSGDADASLQGKLYVDAATVDADVTATDLTAQAGAQIKAILAAGPRVGGVRLGVYDAAGLEDPSDALDALVTAGYHPGWDWTIAVVQARVDATIAIASTWVHTNARGMALVAGQLNTSSILSGTVPVGIAASAGADLTVCYYDDTNTSAGIEAFIGSILAFDTTKQRPGWAITQPSGLPAYAAELTSTQIVAASGIGVSQARCIVSSPLTPAGTRTTYAGYTVGGTKAEIEFGVIVLQLRFLQAVASWITSRASLQLPIRTTPQDADAGKTVLDAVLINGVAAGYVNTGVAANPGTGQPALPDGFVSTVTFSGSNLVYNVWVAYPGDVRQVTGTILGVVT